MCIHQFLELVEAVAVERIERLIEQPQRCAGRDDACEGRTLGLPRGQQSNGEFSEGSQAKGRYSVVDVANPKAEGAADGKLAVKCKMIIGESKLDTIDLSPFLLK